MFFVGRISSNWVLIFQLWDAEKHLQNVMIPEGLREFLTQIPGFAAPPGGPLARGDTVELVVDGLSWRVGSQHYF